MAQESKRTTDQLPAPLAERLGARPPDEARFVITRHVSLLRTQHLINSQIFRSRPNIECDLNTFLQDGALQSRGRLRSSIGYLGRSRALALAQWVSDPAFVLIHAATGMGVDKRLGGRVACSKRTLVCEHMAVEDDHFDLKGGAGAASRGVV